MFDEHYYKELREDIERAIALSEEIEERKKSILGGNSLMPQQIAQPHLSVKYAQNENFAPSDNELFPEQKYDLLGLKESGGDYTKVVSKKGKEVVWGKYQFRKPALQDLGYMNAQGEWIGKDQIYSTEDFKNNPELQEKMIRNYMTILNRYNKFYNNYSKNGASLQGLKKNFNITKSGILAAGHRRGALDVANYLNALEKNENNQYYLPYHKFPAERQEELKEIETRLREFE